MNCKTLNIIFLWCILFGGYLNAQSIKINAIELTAIGQIGDGDHGNYEYFVYNTRNPALFQSGLIDQPDKFGIIRNSGFAIDFIFNQDDEPVNEFILGIQSGSIETEIFKDLSFQDDSLTFNSDVTNISQFFTVRAGYHRVFRADKRIRLLAGTMLQFGVPVSSNTTQTVTTDFFTDEYKFFAKQSVSVGYTISYGLRFTLFRNVHASLLSRPTFYFSRVDGSLSSSLLRGTNLSIQFKIRP
jgi:hypothetical protein